MSTFHDANRRADETTESVCNPLAAVQRKRRQYVLWTMLVLVSVTGVALIELVHRNRSKRQQTIEREIDNVVYKWDGVAEPRLSEVPPDLDVMIRDDFDFVDVSSVHPTDELRERLSRLRRVQWLGLSTETTPEDLAWIGELTQLRGLSLAGAKLKGADFSHFAKLRSLQLLDLSRAHIPAQDFATLPWLRGLKCIAFEGNKITDQHIIHLAELQLPSLERLRLENTSVTDAGFADLWRNTI